MEADVWFGKKDVRVEDVPEPPAPGPGEVKIKVHQTGICGSDLHEYDAGPIFIPTEQPHPLTGKKAPLILGKETDVAAEIQDQTDGQGVDVAIECIGKAETVNTCIQCTKRGGTTVVAGIFENPGEINYNDLVFQERKVVGSLAYYGEFETAIALLADGRLKTEPLITGKIKLDDINKNGFEELLKNRDANIKVLVAP